MAPYSSPGVIQVSGRVKIPNWILKKLFNPWVKIHSAAIKLKVFKVGAQAQLRGEGVDIVFLNEFWINAGEAVWSPLVGWFFML